MTTERIKWNRTYHFPWSPGTTSDDRILPSIEHFLGREIVVTEKVDGENTTMYSDGHTHARSVDSKHHWSRTRMKQTAERLKNLDLPDTWTIHGENMVAKHSIQYSSLTGYFLVFGICDRRQTLLSWDETVDIAHNLLGLQTVPVLYRGVWDEERVKACFTGESLFGGQQEGYVVRFADAFPFDEYQLAAAKYVRAKHCGTGPHWLRQKPEYNLLKGEEDETSS